MFSEKVCTTDFPFYLLINSNLSVKPWSVPMTIHDGTCTDGKALTAMSNMLCPPFFGYHFAISQRSSFHSSNHVYGTIWLSAAKLPWVISNPAQTKFWFPTLLPRLSVSVGTLCQQHLYVLFKNLLKLPKNWSSIHMGLNQGHWLWDEAKVIWRKGHFQPPYSLALLCTPFPSHRTCFIGGNTN